MDFILGLTSDIQDRTDILVFVDRTSKMTNLIPVHATITTVETAAHFVDAVFRHRGIPENILLERDSLFTSAFWTLLFELRGTKLQMSTSAYPKRTGKPSVSSESSKVFFEVMQFPARIEVHSYRLLSSHSTMLYTLTGLTPLFVNST